MKHLILALLLLLTPLVAGDSELTLITDSATAVTTRTSDIYSLTLSNTSGSAVTCTIRDRTTRFSGDGYPFWPGVSIAANTAYVVGFPDKRTLWTAVDGFKWSCSTTNVVLGQVGYRER